MLYFDNAATTPVDKAVQEIVNKYNVERFYNPSSLHCFALDVARDIKQARDELCAMLHGSGRIVFTSCGTEADNLALNSCLRAKKGNLVLSGGEHSAVYNAVTALSDKYDVRILPLNNDGSAKNEEIGRLVDADTLALCLMHVNNETGAINDVADAVKRVKNINSNCAVICDGIQAMGKINVNLDALGVDYYTASGHKIHAPKGIGFLYAKKGAPIRPQILGGGQEGGLRSGTENVAGIMALYNATKQALQAQSDNCEHFLSYKQLILEHLQQDWYKLICPDASPAILTLAFDRLESQILLNMLEQKGIIIGLGSACNSKKASRVMKTIDLPRNYTDGVVRISFSRFNTAQDVKTLAVNLQQCVENLRTIKGIK